jgi:hypothetical protein
VKTEVNRTTKQWTRIANQLLEDDDNIRYTYTVRCNDQYGHLILTNQKLLFIEEQGFLSKTHTVRADVPYDDIEKVMTQKRQLTITTANAKHYTIKSGISDGITANIEELKKAVVPEIIA